MSLWKPLDLKNLIAMEEIGEEKAMRKARETGEDS